MVGILLASPPFTCTETTLSDFVPVKKRCLYIGVESKGNTGTCYRPSAAIVRRARQAAKGTHHQLAVRSRLKRCGVPSRETCGL